MSCHYNENYKYYCNILDKNLCPKCYDYYEGDYRYCLKFSEKKPSINDIDYLKNKNKEYEEIIKKYTNIIKLNNLIINPFEKNSNNYYNIFNINSIIKLY